MKKELIKLLIEYKIIKFAFKQPIPFKSKLKSPIYFNFRECWVHPDIMELICRMFHESLRNENIEVVAGVPIGATPHAGRLATAMNLPFASVRPGATAKEYGLKNIIEGANVSDQILVLIEDLVTTGGSIIDNAIILRQAGAKVNLRSIFTYDFEVSKKKFAENGFSDQFKSLITIHDVIPYLQEVLSADEFASLQDFVREPGGWFDRHKTTFQFGYLTQLRCSAKDTNSLVSFGWDPVINSLSVEFRRDGILGYGNFMSIVFNEMKAKGVMPGMIKPNLGFWAMHDFPHIGNYHGSNALAATMKEFYETFPSSIPITLDNKTGDIGKSSENWAFFGYNNWKADAVTVHFDMGQDSVEPYSRYCQSDSRGLYMLNKTSNSGSKDFQMAKMADGRFLYQQVGDKVIEWAKGKPGLGVVIGGNSLDELRTLLSFYAGKDIPALVPGVGVQGGSAKQVANVAREVGFELELLRVNVSSGITHPWYKKEGDPIPSTNECVEMSVHALQMLNEEVGYRVAV